MMKNLPYGQDGATFREEITVCRKPTLITDEYVLCQDHDLANVRRNGDINIRYAAQATLIGTVLFGTTPATSVEILPVFVPMSQDGVSAAPVGPVGTLCTGVIALGDMAAAGDPWKTVTSATGGFADWMVGHYLQVCSGTNWILTPTKILAVTDTNTIVVETAVATQNVTSGAGYVSLMQQEMAMSTAAGLTTLTPHYFQMVAANCGGSAANNTGVSFAFTLPLPAMPFMRLYAKGTGTLTASSLKLAYNLMPAGGV